MKSRDAYLRATARHHLSPRGWTSYAPLGRPGGLRYRWRRTLAWRLLTLPYAVRAAGRAYDREKPW